MAYEQDDRQQQQTFQPPSGPPPGYVPQPQMSHGEISTMAVDPGAIRRCLYRWTYIWLRGREQFWFFPVHIGRHSVAGYRWTGRHAIYFGVDLRRIQQFQCV